jgi:dipeptidyl aminopeptidase/acylaminoacyl peptidase
MKLYTKAFILSSAYIIFIFISAVAQSQTAPPSTEIFLVDLGNRNDRLRVGDLRNITNRDGYDNQPAFIDGGQSILFTSIREDNQADIYKYNIKADSLTRITETKEGEYSPTLTPDGKYISVIRVEADSTQRLWKFPLKGGSPALILETIKPVGYHVWVNAGTVIVFILGTPNTLQIVDIKSEKVEIISENVGRSLHRRPGQQKFTFVHKLSDKEWVIKELDAKTREVTTLIKTLPGSEDYVWMPDGMALMANGSKLFKWDPKKKEDWQEVADFSGAGLKSITRLAVSPKGDRLALVATMESK